MASDAEPAKLLLPFLQRADELQKHEPLVAYYCRLYAMERGLKIPQKERTKTTNALLTSLMNQLEKDKKSLKLSTEDHLYLEGFATNVFTKADKQDRAGRADLNTAKTFYAASIFFEILNQFGELPPDIEQKLKYAVWKAADIRKALKEGRKPEPGPPGGDKDLLDPSSPQANAPDSNQSFQTNFPNQTSSDHIEQQDHARNTSFNYTAANVPSQPAYKDPRNENINYSGVTPSSQHTDMPINQGDPYATLHAHTSPSYSSTDYQHYPQTYEQNYNNSYSYEQPSLTQNLPPEHQPLSYAYPNFQSYPSFQESTFPVAPTHQPSYSHGSEPVVASPLPNYQSTAQYGSPKNNGNHVGPLVLPVDHYKYDSNYQPPVEKIAEAHKAARFAVGALAFDDVPVAVDFLRRSLELLTNPSAETH